MLTLLFSTVSVFKNYLYQLYNDVSKYHLRELLFYHGLAEDSQDLKGAATPQQVSLTPPKTVTAKIWKKFIFNKNFPRLLKLSSLIGNMVVNIALLIREILSFSAVT